MSDTIKLSELLEAGAHALRYSADSYLDGGYDDSGRAAARNHTALRAIAPALVTAMKDAVGRHIEVDDWNLCPACRFEHILEEAGVTCD